MVQGIPNTPFPFPDLLPVGTPFPREVTPETHIASLSSWWLWVRCGCKGEGGTAIPFRLMAAQRGWQTPLGLVVGKLRCKECGSAPRVVTLLENAGGQKHYNPQEIDLAWMIRGDGGPSD